MILRANTATNLAPESVAHLRELAPYVVRYKYMWFVVCRELSQQPVPSYHVYFSDFKNSAPIYTIYMLRLKGSPGASVIKGTQLPPTLCQASYLPITFTHIFGLSHDPIYVDIIHTSKALHRG